MTTMQIIAVIGAAVAAFGPQTPSAVRWAIGLWQDDHTVPLPKPLEEAIAPSYQSAIANLAAVRFRLRATERLGEEQRKAVDVLTLALVDGSDV
jgi:hypothetical protein